MGDESMKPRARVLPRLTGAQYHRDPCERPSLSASCANVLLAKSAYHAWLQHPRLGGVQREATDAMDAGSLLHALLLEGGAGVEVIDAEDFRTNAAKTARDAARAAHRVPVLAKVYDAACALADDVGAQLRALGIDLATGESEVSVEWTETTDDGTDVLCRGRMDHLWLDRGLILDLKTCQSAHPRAVTKHVEAYGYHIQRAAYVSAMNKIRPDLAGRNPDPFTFVFCETLPAASKRRAIVQPVKLDALFRETGERRWKRAVETWARCIATDEWPAYAPTGETMVVEAPGWTLAEEGI